MLITYHSLIRGFSRGSQGRNRGNSVFFWLRRVSLPPLGFLAHLSSGSVGTKPPQNHPPTHPPQSHPPSPTTEGGGTGGTAHPPSRTRSSESEPLSRSEALQDAEAVLSREPSHAKARYRRGGSGRLESRPKTGGRSRRRWGPNTEGTEVDRRK